MEEFVDIHTGEIISEEKALKLFNDNGQLLDDEGNVIAIRPENAIVIETEKDFEIVMDLLNDTVMEMVKLEEKEKILMDNIAKIKKRLQSKMKAQLMIYGEKLQEYALKNMPKGKKSITCPFGTVKFRKEGGGIEIINPDKAIEWAEKHCPEAIKIEKSVLKSKIPDELRFMFDEDALREVPQTDRFIIQIGNKSIQVK